jgi:hypothetical protein
MGAEGCFTGIKRPGREADHSSPSNAGFKNECSCTTSTSLYAFMVFVRTALPYGGGVGGSSRCSSSGSSSSRNNNSNNNNYKSSDTVTIM